MRICADKEHTWGLEAYSHCVLSRPFADQLMQSVVTLIYALLALALFRVMTRPTASVLGIEIFDRGARVVCGEPACLNYPSLYAKVLQKINLLLDYTYLHIDEPVVAAQVCRRSQTRCGIR